MKINYNGLILGEIDRKENLEKFLKEEFEKEEKLINMGYQEFYPIWAEWYENIMFDYEYIPDNYIQLNQEWYIDKDYINIAN